MKLAVDLHIHSCLSPCASDEMTPNNIVNMAYLKGLNAIAITDHNSALNLPAAAAVAKGRGLVLLPGIEVQSREELHLLCYFPDVDTALEFGGAIYGYLPDMPNNTDVFGPQSVLDEDDEEVQREPRLLVQSLSLSMDEVIALAAQRGGLTVPAHINRPSYSLLAQLGFMPPHLSFPALELYEGAPQPKMDLSKYLVFHSSDSHDLGAILEPSVYIDAESCSARGLLRALQAGQAG